MKILNSVRENIGFRKIWEHKPVRKPSESKQPEMQLGSPIAMVIPLKIK